jgi:hypothetical protein
MLHLWQRGKARYHFGWPAHNYFPLALEPRVRCERAIEVAADADP